MTQKASTFLKVALAWFFAGAGWDLQGRVLDHFLDNWFEHVTWLAWLVN